MPTPLIGAEFTVNASTTGAQLLPSVAATVDGRFAIAWCDANVSDYAMRVFKASGAGDGGERIISVGGVSTEIQNRIEIAPLFNGDLAVVYLDTTINGGDIIYRRYESQYFFGQFDDRSVSVDGLPSEAGLEDNIAIGVAPSGELIVDYFDVAANGVDRERCEIRYTPTHPDGIFAFGSAANIGQMEIFVAPNGNATSISRNNDTGNVEIGSVIVVGPGSNPDIARLADNSVATVRENAGAVMLHLYAPFLTSRTGDITVSGAGTGGQASVCALNDGRLLVVWQEVFISGQDTSDLVLGRLYNIDGTPDSSAFIIDRLTFPTGGNPITGAPRAAELADGRIVVTWQDGTLSNADIKASILDPRIGPVALAGTTFGDQHVGTAFGDVFVSGAGDDVLDGAGGGDTFYAGTGNDNLIGQGGQDLLMGEVGDDTINGGADDDYAYGGIGNDLILGDTGGDTLYGEAGNDNIQGGDAADFLSGGAGADSLSGQAGNDVVNGDDGADYLNGGAGSDTLFGNAGNDVLDGGNTSEAEYLDGGAGADSYIFGAGFGAAIVAAFDDALDGSGDQDIIYFDHNAFANFAAVQAKMSQITVGPNDFTTFITFNNQNIVELRHTFIGQLGADDFAFF